MAELYQLRCRECGKLSGNAPRSFCEDCFSPLEVTYDYDALKKSFRRDALAARPLNIWRYAELLPLPENFRPSLPVGGDRKSTRLNSSHLVISYAVFCLKKKKTTECLIQLTKLGYDATPCTH